MRRSVVPITAVEIKNLSFNDESNLADDESNLADRYLSRL
jgi:hypothetical protein